jgi:hypothetical protein
MKDESEYHVSDIHGQYILNYRHAHIPEGDEAELMVRAFQRDFEVNGPSIARIVRTTLAGWKRYKDHEDARIRRRIAQQSRTLPTTFSAVIWAMKQYYRKNPPMRAKLSGILRQLYQEFGWKSRISALLGGPYVLWNTRREETRLAEGWTYEPPTFYERNEFVEASASEGAPQLVECCRCVTPRVSPKKPQQQESLEPLQPLPLATGAR